MLFSEMLAALSYTISKQVVFILGYDDCLYCWCNDIGNS